MIKDVIFDARRPFQFINVNSPAFKKIKLNGDDLRNYLIEICLSQEQKSTFRPSLTYEDCLPIVQSWVRTFLKCSVNSK